MWRRKKDFQTDIQKLKEFTSKRPALQETLKGVLLHETKRQEDTKLWVKWLRDTNIKLQSLFRIEYYYTLKYDVKVKEGEKHLKKETTATALWVLTVYKGMISDNKNVNGKWANVWICTDERR